MDTLYKVPILSCEFLLVYTCSKTQDQWDTFTRVNEFNTISENSLYGSRLPTQQGNLSAMREEEREEEQKQTT